MSRLFNREVSQFNKENIKMEEDYRLWLETEKLIKYAGQHLTEEELDTLKLQVYIGVGLAMLEEKCDMHLETYHYWKYIEMPEC